MFLMVVSVILHLGGQSVPQDLIVGAEMRRWAGLKRTAIMGLSKQKAICMPPTQTRRKPQNR